MKPIHQGLFGFLAALLSIAVILGSLSLSLSETGLKLAIKITPTPTPGLRFPTMTPIMSQATNIPGEPTRQPSVTPTVSPATATPTAPLVTLPEYSSSCQYPEGWVPVKVQFGDTLAALANYYQITVDELVEANCIPPDYLIVGTILYVPNIPPEVTPSPTSSIQCGPPSNWTGIYIVKPGDTLFQISLQFGVTVAELQFANCLTSTLITSGSRLIVPFMPAQAPTATPTFRVPTVLPPDTPTSTPLPSPTIVVLPTNTPTRIPTNTPVPNSPTPTSSKTPRPTSLPTDTATPVSPTSTTTNTPTETPTTTSSPTSTLTSTPTETSTPSLVPSATGTSTPSPTPSTTVTTTSVSAILTLTPTPTPSPTGNQ